MCHLQVCFEVRVLEKLPVAMPETETNPHVVRVGWSVDRANLQVSEAQWLLDPLRCTTHKGRKLNFPMQLPDKHRTFTFT